jgi:hypothetical protein
MPCAGATTSHVRDSDSDRDEARGRLSDRRAHFGGQKKTYQCARAALQLGESIRMNARLVG